MRLYWLLVIAAAVAAGVPTAVAGVAAAGDHYVLREIAVAVAAREGFVSMCACTEPVRTGIGAVCVEYGRPKWPITILNHTNK